MNKKHFHILLLVLGFAIFASTTQQPNTAAYRTVLGKYNKANPKKSKIHFKKFKRKSGEFVVEEMRFTTKRDTVYIYQKGKLSGQVSARIFPVTVDAQGDARLMAMSGCSGACSGCEPPIIVSNCTELNCENATCVDEFELARCMCHEEGGSSPCQAGSIDTDVNDILETQTM